MKRLRILTLVCVLVAFGIHKLKKDNSSTVASGEGLVVDKAWLFQNESTLTPEADLRPADQTFLTYPEWFLVHSPAEQADYFKSHTSTSFPYLTHIDQIWDSYNIVSEQIEEDFAYNEGYHFMIKLIGTSATIEYTGKAWYETVIGRVTDTDEVLTDEDKLNYQFTQDYVNFIREIPWYEFDFQSRLNTLWGETSFFGPHFFRKLERRYILTSELLIKAGYAKLIKMGTQSMYEEAALTTVVVVDGFNPDLNKNESIEVLKVTEDSSYVLRVPRYAAFNQTASELSNQGVSFIEIAGNTSAILLTVLADNKNELVLNTPNYTILFEQPIASNPETKRIALVTPVSDLHIIFSALKINNITIEHIYDY